MKVQMRRMVIPGAIVILGIALYTCGQTNRSEWDNLLHADEPVSDVQEFGLQGESFLSDLTIREDAKVQDEVDTIFVYICGEVVHPGVYELEAGSRLHSLVNLAGGFLEHADREALNQAQLLFDEQRIQIPTSAEFMEESGNVQSQSDSSRVQSGSPLLGGDGMDESRKVNINTASISDLCTLSGIGKQRAKAIIKYRTEQGLFQKVEDIMKVTGIKQGIFDAIKDSIEIAD